MSSSSNSSKMSFNAAWAMAVGGMVGGGIFSVLGVVISLAGQYAWLSFLLAGIIALIAAHSYSQLSIKYNEAGGSFLFLRKIHFNGIAGSLSWILILGYTLTISVYAYTFGEYLANLFGASPLWAKAFSFLAISFLSLINLKGVENSSLIEVITVYGKLLILLGLAVYGIMDFHPKMLTQGIEPKPIGKALSGAALIFMAYEGFQLLSYDYEDIEHPEKNLPKASFIAVICVILIYILVAIGATSLVGADKIIEQKEVSLAIAGEKALGIFGLILVSVAAIFSTASAINATLFSTARFMEYVSKKRELPKLFLKENQHKVPSYAILIVAFFATLLSMFGDLNNLVDAASLIFLITFGLVCFIGFKEKIRFRYFSLTGAFFCLLASIVSISEQLKHSPIPLFFSLGTVIAIFILHPVLIKRL